MSLPIYRLVCMKDSAVTGREATTQLRAALGLLDTIDSSTQGIDRLQLIAAQKATLDAIEAQEIADLAAIRAEEEAAQGVPKSERCKGLGSEIGLAIGESTFRGNRLLNASHALVYEMPNTMDALAAGEINLERANVVVTETNWLSTQHRAEVDELMAGKFVGLGPKKLGGKVRAHAQTLDPVGAVKRHDKAVTERRVSVRPAADGMSYLTALLPTQQAIAAYAALQRRATTQGTPQADDSEDPEQQPRTRDQIMADSLVELTTGQTTADGVAIEVQLVMSDGALFGVDETPAKLVGHGPIPAHLARRMLENPEGEKFLRRLFTRPKDHQLVSLESRARSFPKGIQRMLALRDNTCRTPFCDAPIQEYDHVTPYYEGGPTNWANGSGLCAGCNQAKENRGWLHAVTDEGLTVTTPTGHTYTTPNGPILEGLPSNTGSPDDETDDELTTDIGPINIAMPRQLVSMT